MGQERREDVLGGALATASSAWNIAPGPNDVDGRGNANAGQHRFFSLCDRSTFEFRLESMKIKTEANEEQRLKKKGCAALLEVKEKS